MSDTLNAQQVISVAQCLTRFQDAITDYELRHYAALTTPQKSRIEQALSVISASAGRLYAYAVVLEFSDISRDLKQLQTASGQLKKFLKTVQKIQLVLDLVGAAAAVAAAIMSHDVSGITNGIDSVLEITGIS